MRFRSLASLCLAAVLTGCAAPPPPPVSGPKTVILISLDGFRADYMTRGLTPVLQSLAQSGVTTPGMHPSFPSITFPNHYTIATGLRPDRNGIVSNTMRDPGQPGVTFKLSDHAVTGDPRWWNEATPIWVSAEQHGLPSATMFWPGSDTAIQGVRPTHWRAFDHAMSSDDRARRLLDWFDVPADQRPRFATLYMDVVDGAGHHDGPNSTNVNAAIATVDHAVGILVDGLKQRGIPADLIVVADHGMAAIGDGQVIDLSSIVPSDTADIVTGGAYAGIDARPGQDAALAHALLAPHPHMQCWRKADVPARFHYGANPRVPAFVCLADVGWYISGHGHRPDERGTHGYDPLAPEMQALFIAHGPDFVAGRTVAPFDNVDLHPLMLHLLHLPRMNDDGTMTPFLPVLTAETR